MIERATFVPLVLESTGALGDPGITTPTFTQEEMAAAVDEARSAGLPVAAHAYTEEGIRRAVLAGVKTIEHGTG